MQEQAKIVSVKQYQKNDLNDSMVDSVNDFVITLPQIPFIVSSTGLSDVGLVRQNNEDAWGSEPDIGLYILADGMGGHQAGEVAARETVNALKNSIRASFNSDYPLNLQSLSEVSNFLKKVIVYSNSVVYKMSQMSENLRGMGTTLCCMLFHNNGLVYGHVGDSRIYRMRGKKLEQLTKDHSLLCQLIDKGQLNENQATGFVYKNIITKAIGTDPKVEPSIARKRVAPDDVFLMCSDGLSDLLSSEEILEILTTYPTIEQAAKRFIDSANEKGGRDNITVLIAKIEPENSQNDTANISR